MILCRLDDEGMIGVGYEYAICNCHRLGMQKLTEVKYSVSGVTHEHV